MDYTTRMLELASERFHCSQIILMIALELGGKKNAELVRTMNALAGGMGNSGGVCGALTGGICMIGYFCGRGTKEETGHGDLDFMIQELIEWFTIQNGSVQCSDLLRGDPLNRINLCPKLVQSVFEQTMDILMNHDVEIDE